MVHMNQASIVLQTILALWQTQRGAIDNSTDVAADTQPASAPAINIPSTTPWVQDIQRQDDATFQCYERYGCFNIDGPWPKNRPTNLFPQHPSKINPNFCLYTTRIPENTCQVLDANDKRTFFKSSIQGRVKTYFIIHGFLESKNKTWIKKLAYELLKNDNDANVIAVDWQGGSGPPYTQAVANIRLVGRAVAELISKLKEEIGINPEKCHIIGHSLGSHTAGYAGYALAQWNHRLGRITGLDPAEPHFVNTDPEVRLDPTDAIYVDVIHTDAAPFTSGGFGLREPVGHMDFYPNGGETQAGCEKKLLDAISYDSGGSLLLGLRHAVGCNHIRSYELFTESINTECEFLTVECESYEKFEAGDCFSCPSSYYYNIDPTCSRLGLHSFATPPRTNVRLYSKTLGTAPFCSHHYRVELQVSNSSSSFSHGGEIGELYLILWDDRNTSSSRMRVQDVASYFKPGDRRRRVVAGSRLEHITQGTIEWEYHSSLINPLTWRLIVTPKIYLEWIRVDVLETGQSVYLCTGAEPIKSGMKMNLTASRNSCRNSKHPVAH